MAFSDALAPVKTEGAVTTFAIGEEWLQGRSVFGGLQGAIALRAMRPLVDPAMTLRALQVTFVAPVPNGEVPVSARVIRAGKSVAHVEARIGDAMIAIGVFGRPRESVIAVTPAQPRVEVEGGEKRTLPYVPGLAPAFLQNFELRWLEGGFPFSGTKATGAVIEVDHRDLAAGGRASEGHVVAVADVPPPLALSMLGAPSPGSSVTWSLDFLRDKVDDLAVTGYRLDVVLEAARSGYTNQSIMIWGPGGEAVARGHQCMVVFG